MYLKKNMSKYKINKYTKTSLSIFDKIFDAFSNRSKEYTPKTFESNNQIKFE